MSEVLVEQVVGAEVSDARIESLLPLVRAVEAELSSDDPPVGAAELRLRYLHEGRSTRPAEHFVAISSSGVVVGMASLDHFTAGTNTELAVLGVGVHPEHRDGDAAPALVRSALERAWTRGRRSVVGWAPLTDWSQALWASLGAALRQVERTSRLDVESVDPALMDAWIARATERAGGYELAEWLDRCPDELLDGFVAAKDAMNDAPSDDLEVEDEHPTAAHVREGEQWSASIGFRHRVLAAVEQSSGRVAGFTEILVNTHRPAVSHQGDTVVLRAHRERGIGRWLKAEMWRRLRADSPEVRVLETENAESNAPMLAMNVAMGFRPHHRVGFWQAPVATVLELAGGDPS